MFVSKLRSLAPSLALAAALAGSSCASCRRPAEVSEATYREAVTAFHTALAALETSQDALARQKLDRVIALVPQEPAGWANLGLLLLRQQENGPAKERLAKAAALAPQNAAIERLLAITESRAGNPAESIRHWRRALELEPGNARAAYALAQETERQGSPESDAEAQRILETLLATSDLLPARLDAMRLAAKRGDGAALTAGLTVLGRLAPAWPAQAQAQLDALRQAAAANPRSAATRVVFLKNVLVREPAYRRALAQVSTPLDAVGEPLEQFVVLANPKPGAAAPDLALSFSPDPKQSGEAGVTWVGVFVATPEASPGLTTVQARAAHPFLPLSAAAAASTGPDSIVMADINYDFRTDVVSASAAGVRFLRAGTDGRLVDVTRETKLPAAMTGAAARAAWAADADTDGDLDVVLAPVKGAPVLLRNNGDGTFTAQQPFAGVSNVRGFAWADLDGEGVPDAAFLDDAGRVHVQLNLRGGAFQADPLANGGGVVGIVALEATGDSTFDLVTLGADRIDRRAVAGRSCLDAHGVGPRRHRGRRRAPPRRRSRQQRRRRSGGRQGRSLDGAPQRRSRAVHPARAAAGGGHPHRRRSRWRWPPRAGRARRRPRRRPREHRHEGLRLAGRAAEGGDRDRRSAHQLVRRRRIDRSADRPAPAAPADRRPDRPRRPRHGLCRRGHPDRVAERCPAVRVRPAGPDHHRRQPAPQGLVSMAVRVERPRDGLRDRPDLALAARPAHQRPGNRRRPDDGGFGQGPRRSARRS